MATSATEMHYGPILASADDTHVIDCEACGFAHLNPIPDLTGYYETEYYQKVKPDYAEAWERDQSWMLMWYDEYLKNILRFLGYEAEDIFVTETDAGLPYLLDYGCGPGWLTRYASRRFISFGYDVGIETDRSLFFNDINHLTFDGADAITFLESLEHISNPIEVLGWCHEYLIDNGLLLIVVPNDFNPLQSIFSTHDKTFDEGSQPFDAWWVSVPDHVNYFTPDSIANLLHKTGFHILDWHTTFPMEVFLLMGMNYVGDREVGRKCHEMRKTFEMNTPPLLRRQIYDALKELHIGREIVIYARKSTDAIDNLEQRALSYGKQHWQGDTASHLGGFVEEVGELTAAIARDDKRDARKQIGDVLARLAQLAAGMNTSLSTCLDYKLTQKERRRR